MKKFFIGRENLKVLIERLKQECDEFIAPRKEHLDDLIFGDTKNDDAQLLDYEGNSVISPRAYLLPQTEVLFEIKSAAKNELAPVEERKRRVFYGVRPCDIKALELMEEFFLRDFRDTFYLEKLQHSVFIALSCKKPCSINCFCYEMSAGPVAKSGFDLQLLPVSRGFIVEAGSKLGRHIITDNKILFISPSTSDEKESAEAEKDFAKGAKGSSCRKAARLMQEDRIRQSVWDDIGQRCVVCSGCITLCPTCSCFSIADRVKNDSGARYRYCDGCVFAGFTKMAGGTTPYPLHKDHIRRFFEHKLNVDVVRYGRSSCVGCGRCIQTCPGNISIKKFIEEAV